MAKYWICAVLRELNLTDCEGWRHNALNRKPNELEKQEQSDVTKLAKSNAELKEVVEAAHESMERAGADVQGESQGTRRRTEEIESSSGSGQKPDANGTPEVRRPTLRKKKYSVYKLCCTMK